MADDIEKASIRDRRLMRFGHASRREGLGMLRPTVMDFFPHTLRGHGLRPRMKRNDGSQWKQESCIEPSCILNRPKGTAHSDRLQNVKEWLDSVKG